MRLESGILLEAGEWETTKHESMPSPRKVTVSKRVVDLLRPAILNRGGPRRQLHRTSYLDGLRGFAAFLVYWQHHQLWPRTGFTSNMIFENAWGFKDQYYFVALPGIRTFFTGGHLAVAVFLIISGYVLSAKPLSLIHAGEYARVGDNLSSAMFRRWLRLHLPVMCTTFMFMTSWHLFGIWTSTPKHKSNYRDELWNWYIEFKNFSFVFRTGGESWFIYNFHSWTIPIEFRGSMIVYTALLALSKATRNARLLCQLGLIFYFMYIVDGWFGAMFMAGMLFCDLDLLAKNDELPQFFSTFKPYEASISYTLLVIGIYLGGVPSFFGGTFADLQISPGWYYLSLLKPQAFLDHKWFYLFWAAVFLMIAIPRIKWLKAFFETRFCQYLGRISYALYLMHGPILWTLGDRLYVATGWHNDLHVENIPEWVDIFPLSREGPLGFEPCFLLPHIILLPTTLWLAEIVTRLIDDPSVKFARWAHTATLEPSM